MSIINNLLCSLNFHKLDSNCKCQNCGKELHTADTPKEERESDSDAYEDLPSKHYLVTRCRRCKKVLDKRRKRIPGHCYKCNKPLDGGSDLLTMMANKSYPCQSCGTQYCVDCLSHIIEHEARLCHSSCPNPFLYAAKEEYVNRWCPYCGKNVGSYSIRRF